MSENIKVDIDTTGLSNLVTSLKTEYDKYVLSADNLSKEIENIVNCWNGPDCDAYMIKARTNVKKTQVLKLILSDYITAIENLINKIDNHNGF